MSPLAKELQHIGTDTEGNTDVTVSVVVTAPLEDLRKVGNLSKCRDELEGKLQMMIVVNEEG